MREKTRPFERYAVRAPMTDELADLRQVFTLLEREPIFTSVGAPTSPDEAARPDASEVRASFANEGVAVLPGLLSRERAGALVDTVRALQARGLPPVFAYVLEAFWEPLARLVPIVESVIGPCDVLADGWAWDIPPTAGRAGWAPHRGAYELVRQADGRPGLVNVWVALSDVTRETACMHVLPLSKDSGYPDALRREPFDSEHAVAYPLAAGSALFWDASSLHWGGPMLPGAPHARVAYSFTLRAKGVDYLSDFGTVNPEQLPRKTALLDLVATQILRYGSLDDVPLPFVKWAAFLQSLRKSVAR
jgi:hypothetical protein